MALSNEQLVDIIFMLWDRVDALEAKVAALELKLREKHCSKAPFSTGTRKPHRKTLARDSLILANRGPHPLRP
jgi:hypothetical protein